MAQFSTVLFCRKVPKRKEDELRKMGSEEFIRIQVQGFQGSWINSTVFELTRDHDLPMKPEKLKESVNDLVNQAIDKSAEEIIIYLNTMKRLIKPR
jgi:hypothetical protein